MNPLILAQEIIDGRRITRKDDLSFFLTCDLDELCEGADRIREAYIGDKVDLCSIINGRSGRCPENCKYCAQSVHHHTSCEIYDFLPEEKILEACKMNEEEGVDRFSIVTAGKALTGKEFDQAIHAYETMYKECNIDRLNHPIPTHTIQILMAFVNTTASSPREIPYPIKQTPTSIRINAGHLLFHVLLVFNSSIYFPSVTFSSSFSTISFHSSRLWLPE